MKVGGVGLWGRVLGRPLGRALLPREDRAGTERSPDGRDPRLWCGAGRGGKPCLVGRGVGGPPCPLSHLPNCL